MITFNVSLFAHGENSFIVIDENGGQEVPKSLQTIVSVDLEEVPLEEALSVIAEKGKFKLNYNRNRIPVNKKVSLKMDNVPAIKPLLIILNDTGTGLIITKGEQLAIIPSSKAQGEIKGVVVDKKSREPLAGVNVVVLGTQIGASTNRDGRFLIPELSTGIYSVEASMIGYATKRIDDVVITEDASVKVPFELAEAVIPLNEIIVTPGHFSLMEKEPASSKALKAEDIRSFPQLGEDIYRAINRLPGVSGNDVSAKFIIRGGEYDEVLVLLDGMELYDPFHLKDLDGFFSIIDVEAIRSIDMMTGAFPVEYGNRLSGVFNMKTVSPTVKNRRTSLAISFLNARFLTQGSTANGKWQWLFLAWLFLARRGYLDLLLKWLNPEDEIRPVYYDVLSKIQYSINSRHSIAAHVLTSDDDVVLIETDDELEFNTGYANTYGWLTWYGQFHPKLFAQTVLSSGRVTEERDVKQIPGKDADFEGEARVKRNFNFYGLKQDWSIELSDRSLLKWGFAVRHLTAGYDFFFREPIIIGHENGNEIFAYELTNTKEDPDGNELSVYLGNRFRLFTPLTAELGVRYDYTSWTGDKNISPRINFAYNLNKQTVIRAGWGKYYQTQGIHKLNAVDGDQRFYPAELAEHRVVGIEHEFKNGLNLRVEAYQKKLSSIRSRYQNFRGFALNPFAEIHTDRIRVEPERGESRGFEIYIKKDSGDKFRWWASYSYAIAEDVIDGVTVPRDFDQRHTVYLDLNYRPNKKWHLNVAWQYHSGWPFTETQVTNVKQWPDGYFDIEWVPGPLNAGRLPAYHRMDIRVNREFKTSRGRVCISGSEESIQQGEHQGI
jgi:outer membrane receptor protein involved in Fe transport